MGIVSKQNGAATGKPDPLVPSHKVRIVQKHGDLLKMRPPPPQERMAKARLNREARREVHRPGKEGRRCLRSICNETEKISAALFACSPFLSVVQQATAHSQRNLAGQEFRAAARLFFPTVVQLRG
jgi:hypothetical protein